MNLKASDFPVAEDLQALCKSAGLEIIKTANTPNNLGVTPYVALAAMLRRLMEEESL